MAVHLDAKGKAGSDYKVSLVEGKNADETELLFRFEPQYTTTGVITTHHFLRVRHETFDNVPVYLMAERRGAVAAAGSEPPSPSPVGGKAAEAEVAMATARITRSRCSR